MVKADILQWMEDNSNLLPEDPTAEDLVDILWTDDSVTGNGSGSYTCNREKAKEIVLSHMDDVAEALREFVFDETEVGRMFLEQEWEKMDVITRCYYLYSACDEALNG